MMGAQFRIASIALFVLSGCHRAAETHDAGPSPSPVIAPRASPSPTAPPPFALTPTDGCLPYWRLVEDGCRNEASTLRRCDPAHEKLARASLVGIERGASKHRIHELLEGVEWNDDPENLLGADPSGVTWCRAFDDARRLAQKGSVKTLLGRSQFGDLQFLHGLATKPGETNRQSYLAVMTWLEFTYRVGSREIDPATKLRAVPVKGFAALFPRDGGRTVAELFHTPPDGDVSARALGSLLHVLQDLAGEGHTASAGVPAPGGKRTLAHHFTTARGAHPLHRFDTGWEKLWADDATLSSWGQAARVVQEGADIIRLAAGRQPWATAKQYLDETVFSYSTLDAPAARASPSGGE